MHNETERLKGLLCSIMVKAPQASQALDEVLQAWPADAREQFLIDLFALNPEDVGRAVMYTGEAEPEPEKPPYTLHTIDEIFAPLPPMEWIVDGVFSKGSLSMLAGAPGSKKTYSLLYAGMCVALGRPWLDYPTRQAKVLIVDEENGEIRLRNRLREVLHGVDPDARPPLQYAFNERFNFRNPHDQARFYAMVQESGAEFVVVDSLAAVMAGGDENSVKDVQPVFLFLRQVANDNNCAIVLIHHTNKMGGYRGSSAISGAVDLLLMVESEGKSSEMKFRSEKTRDVEPFSFAALTRFEEERFYMLRDADTPPTASVSTSETNLLRYLQENGPTSKKKLEDGCGLEMPRGTAIKAIYSLLDKGLIERTNPATAGRGVQAVYTISENIDTTSSPEDQPSLLS